MTDPTRPNVSIQLAFGFVDRLGRTIRDELMIPKAYFTNPLLRHSYTGP